MSAAFLLVIAAINLLVLRGVVRAFASVKRGEPYDDQNLEAADGAVGHPRPNLPPDAPAGRSKLEDVSRRFSLRLGFDTATEVGVLGISAAAGTQGLPIWSILIFPTLFTAGMCLVDTADGLLMLGAYGWAFVHPVRKLYYNMTITAVSVIIAVVVGGFEVLAVVRDQLALSGRFWNAVGSVGENFGTIGILIIAIFIFSWLASAATYRLMGYKQLESAEVTPVATDRDRDLNCACMACSVSHRNGTMNRVSS